MNALFINLPTQACGVADFGRRLFSILEKSERVKWNYHEPLDRADCKVIGHDVIVYNWIDGQGGFLAEAPFPELPCKQVMIYHDGAVSDRFDAIMFADPTMRVDHGKWHAIGRPLPPPFGKTFGPVNVIGVNGFRGAYADRVVRQVLTDFTKATVRMLLPFSHYCDPTGVEALSMAATCRSLVQGTDIKLDISHELLSPEKLQYWLADNSINCYLRDSNWNWRGVSSAPDYALSVPRPIAVSMCNAFRHLHMTTPSICVEDASLPSIIKNGIEPLLPLYSKWAPRKVRDQVDDVILSLQPQ